MPIGDRPGHWDSHSDSDFDSDSLLLSLVLDGSHAIRGKSRSSATFREVASVDNLLASDDAEMICDAVQCDAMRCAHGRFRMWVRQRQCSSARGRLVAAIHRWDIYTHLLSTEPTCSAAPTRPMIGPAHGGLYDSIMNQEVPG